MPIILGKPRIANGQSRPLLALVADRVVRLSHEGFVLTSRDGIAPDGERLGDGHSVLRALLLATFGLVPWRPHGEAACRYDHHLGTGRTVFEGLCLARTRL